MVPPMDGENIEGMPRWDHPWMVGPSRGAQGGTTHGWGVVTSLGSPLFPRRGQGQGGSVPELACHGLGPRPIHTLPCPRVLKLAIYLFIYFSPISSYVTGHLGTARQGEGGDKVQTLPKNTSGVWAGVAPTPPWQVLLWGRRVLRRGQRGPGGVWGSRGTSPPRSGGFTSKKGVVTTSCPFHASTLGSSQHKPVPPEPFRCLY